MKKMHINSSMLMMKRGRQADAGMAPTGPAEQGRAQNRNHADADVSR